MAYAFRLTGKCSVENSAASAISGDFEFRAALNEAVALDKKLDMIVGLDDALVETVSFGDLSIAHVVYLRVLTSGVGKVLAQFTHADGSAQTFVLDPLLIVVSLASGYTALTLQRLGSVAASVQVFLGRKSS